MEFDNVALNPPLDSRAIPGRSVPLPWRQTGGTKPVDRAPVGREFRAVRLCPVGLDDMPDGRTNAAPKAVVDRKPRMATDR